ncbi:MAG: family 78 glycoside hydrolase catalytic domain [Armatimonadetes bacterium]|nr:family 78 glycoside hydrolase catalytic domain [Armatimonadota bacterium]
MMFIPVLFLLASGSLAAAPTDLACEHRRDPAGIDSTQPRLSWIVSSNSRGEVQTAYQILVASSEDLLKANKGDLWDSGKTLSDQSVLVRYAGKPLISEMRCYWKVRTWTNRGGQSEWSKPAFWSMGLLQETDWKGKWIANRIKLDDDETLPLNMKGRGPDAASHVMQKMAGPLLRKTFETRKPLKRATLYACGLGFCELSLNGAKVGDAVLSPTYTKYDRRASYKTYDVTAMLNDGPNVIGAMLGNGWFNCFTRDSWEFDHAPWRTTPRMILQMRLEYTDSTSELVVSDESWRTALSPITFDGIRNGEEYDARLEQPGWDTIDFVEHFEGESKLPGWKPVEIVDGPEGRLVAEISAPVKIMETFKPVKVTEPKPGVFVFDMGRNIAGWCELKVAGPIGTRVTLRYDERLHDDGTLHQSNAGHLATGEFQTDIYTLKGVGLETWEPRFTYHGFQYVQVEGFPGKPTLNSLVCKMTHTSFDKAGEFDCSNELLNKIQRATLLAYVSNFVGFPTDCPHREKNGWTGDAQLATEAGLYNFASESNYERWMFDFADCQLEDGNLPGIVPTGGWGYEWGNGPAWDSAYFLIPWYVYLYRGDATSLKTHYEGYKRYLAFLASKAEDNIVSIGLGDWCPPEGGPGGHATPAALTSTAYYYVDVKIAAKTAQMLGKTEEARQYNALADNIAKSFMAKFYNPDTGKFEGDEQCGMATAIYQGLLPEAEKARVMNAIVAEVEKRKGHIWAGILGAKYMLHALTDNGRADLAYEAAIKRDFPSWGHWIEQGATTLWETWDGGASRNHIMFGDISSWFYQTLAGINPDPTKPGFKHIIIRPRFVGDLTWAKAWHNCPYGRIGSAWKKDANKLTLVIDIPANTTASVYLPGNSVELIKESGKPASKSEGVKYAGLKEGCAVFEVGSGHYEFEVAN